MWIIVSVFCLSSGLHSEIRNLNSSRTHTTPYGTSGCEPEYIRIKAVTVVERLKVSELQQDAKIKQPTRRIFFAITNYDRFTFEGTVHCLRYSEPSHHNPINEELPNLTDLTKTEEHT
jgi:hypothetical protein